VRLPVDVLRCTVHDYFEDILKQLAYAQQHEPDLLQPGSEYLQALLSPNPKNTELMNPKIYAVSCHG